MDQVAEGVKTAKIVGELAEEYSVAMPIAAEMKACVTEGRSAIRAYRGLVIRPATSETAPD